MIRSETNDTVGLLLSGGLDSAILLADLLKQGRRVKPFYVDSQLTWQAAELDATRRYLRSVAQSNLESLTVLDLPLADVYGDHWSITGEATPDAETPDEAVFLPGRNPLLIIKVTLWCALNGIGELAVGHLQSNPFADAGDRFFKDFESALNLAVSDQETCGSVRISRPFASLDKRQVMERGRNLPLDETFSCLRPVDRTHCGRCNKCGERQAAFALAEIKDPTRYAFAAALVS